MTPRVFLVVTALASACASTRVGTTAATTPTAPAQPASTPTTPPLPPVASPSPGVHYGPGALRYLVHRQLHIQQTLGDHVQAQTLGARPLKRPRRRGRAAPAGPVCAWSRARPITSRGAERTRANPTSCRARGPPVGPPSSPPTAATWPARYAIRRP